MVEKLMNSEEVADFLRVPILAVGQIIADRRLEMCSFDSFKFGDVKRLSEEEPAYIASLR